MIIKADLNVSSWSIVDYGRLVELNFHDGSQVHLLRSQIEVDRTGLPEDVIGQVEAEEPPLFPLG